jgi:hypothetical protein
LIFFFSSIFTSNPPVSLGGSTSKIHPPFNLSSPLYPGQRRLLPNDFGSLLMTLDTSTLILPFLEQSILHRGTKMAFTTKKKTDHVNQLLEEL